MHANVVETWKSTRTVNNESRLAIHIGGLGPYIALIVDSWEILY